MQKPHSQVSNIHKTLTESFLVEHIMNSSPVLWMQTMLEQMPSALSIPLADRHKCTALLCFYNLWHQDDDIPGIVRYHTYEVLKNEVDNPRLRWAYLPYSMHMAGPREAIQHMIIRKNYGEQLYRSELLYLCLVKDARTLSLAETWLDPSRR